MFNAGEFAFDRASGNTVQILERIEMWGYTSYKVFDSTSSKVYRATEEQLQKGGNAAQYDENYLRYVTLLAKVKNETFGGFLQCVPMSRHEMKKEANGSFLFDV